MEVHFAPTDCLSWAAVNNSDGTESLCLKLQQPDSRAAGRYKAFRQQTEEAGCWVTFVSQLISVTRDAVSISFGNACQQGEHAEFRNRTGIVTLWVVFDIGLAVV